MNLEKLSRDIRPGHMGTNSHMCRSEENHDIVSRTCSKSSIAQQYCAPSQKARTGGTKDLKEVDTWTTSKPRSMKSVQSDDTGRSRTSENRIVESIDTPKSCPDNNIKTKDTPQRQDMASKNIETAKSGSASLGRRFNDSPAVVPIKKRRIQIAEVMRSPSPPPRPPSPQTPSASPTSASQQSPRHSVSPSAQGNLSTSRLSSPGAGFSSKVPSTLRSQSTSPVREAAVCGSATKEVAKDRWNVDGLKVKDRGLDILPSSHFQHSDQIKEVNEEGIQRVSKTGIEYQIGSHSDNVNEHCSQYQERVAHNASPQAAQEDLPRSESGSLSKDERLHWDLNTEMTTWDNINEQATSKNREDVDCAETPLMSGSRDSDGRCNCVTQQVEKSVSEECIEHKVSQADDCNSVEKESAALVDETECGGVYHGESRGPASCDGELASDGGEGNEKVPIQDEQDDYLEQHSSKSENPIPSPCDDTEVWNHISEEPEAEEHVDYGDSDCRDADDIGLDADDRTSLMQTESNWKADDGDYNKEPDRNSEWEGDGHCNMESEKEGDGMSDLDGTLNKSSSYNDEVPDPSGERRARNRQSGWDKLPEGFDNAEEALKAAKELSSRRGGRAGTWSSAGGRGLLSNSHASGRFGPVQSNNRDGFSSGRADGYYGDRHPDEIRDRETGRRLDDSFRGRNVVRRPGMFGRGRVSGWVDNQVGPMNQWAPVRDRPSGFAGPNNSSAVGAGRVENSGFIVSPDGGVSKNMVPGRGPIRPMVSGNRAGRGGFMEVGRGPVEMDTGVHYPIRAGMGNDRINGVNGAARGLGPGNGQGILGMHERSGSAGRGLIDRYRGGGMGSRRSVSPRRSNHRLDHPNVVNRMPNVRPESRIVRSRSPPPSHRPLDHSDYPSTRSHYSPPPKWTADKRETDGHRDRDVRRSVSRSRAPSQRTSPHVVHGSSLMDDRDRQVLAGTRHSPSFRSPPSSSYPGKPADSSDSRRGRRNEDEDGRHIVSNSKDAGTHSKDEHGRLSPRDSEKEGSYRRERDRYDDRRREPHWSSSKDDRAVSGHKHVTTREADDEVAPRRRRPS